MSGKKSENGFEITTKSSELFKAKQLAFATGVKDIMPNIKDFFGVLEYFGDSLSILSWLRSQK
ncbi:hypothetical protein V6R21_24995 [Limibacter armeniacum]|uniref:hypothetical protein n=1 Tax=Limibacter armeniacum TaxID=466084 RepID=UPI002FE6B501